MADLTRLGFYSENNYLKRSEFVGSQTINLVSGGGGPIDERIITIQHDLGYIPQFHVYGDFFNGDTGLYSPFHNQFIVDPSWVYCYKWATTTTLTLNIMNVPDTTRTLTVYWVIYLDYGGA